MTAFFALRFLLLLYFCAFALFVFAFLLLMLFFHIEKLVIENELMVNQIQISLCRLLLFAVIIH